MPLRMTAQRIGIKADSLRKAAESGDLPSIKVGADYLFDVGRIEQILLERAAAHEGAAHAN